MGEVGQVENKLVRDKCLKKKGKKLVSNENEKKKRMFCEIHLHGKILPKCQLEVDGGM